MEQTKDFGSNHNNFQNNQQPLYKKATNNMNTTEVISTGTELKPAGKMAKFKFAITSPTAKHTAIGFVGGAAVVFVGYKLYNKYFSKKKKENEEQPDAPEKEQADSKE